MKIRITSVPAPFGIKARAAPRFISSHKAVPGFRKRRSKADQDKYFDDFPSKVLSVTNFNYVRRPLGLNNKAYEIVRRSHDSGPSGNGGRRGKGSRRNYKEVEESAGLVDAELIGVEEREGTRYHVRGTAPAERIDAVTAGLVRQDVTVDLWIDLDLAIGFCRCEHF